MDRVIVIGAGPAGLRAAATLVEAGLRPVLLDEGTRAGGQIYRQQPENFRRSAASLYGPDAAKATALHDLARSLVGAVDYRPSTLAWAAEPGLLHIEQEGRTGTLGWDNLILATGATDRLFPIEGWTRPGVYSLGGAQIALKAQACAIGRRIVFMGTGPLLYLVAFQYAKAGASVAAVLDTSGRRDAIAGLVGMAARPRLLARGLAMTRALRRAGIPLHRGVTPLAVVGPEGGGVSAVKIEDAAGRRHEIAADAVAIGFHLRPETQIADLLGCAFAFDAATRQWVVQVDTAGRTSVPGVFMAGDGVRVLGADAAELSGALAAQACLTDGRGTALASTADPLKRGLRRMERFRRGLARTFPWPTRLVHSLGDSTIVCRCECITAGDIRRVARDLGAPEINRAKALSRVGMGRCQGRFCSHAGAEVLADALGVAVESVGRLRGQAPIKPLPVGAHGDSAP